MGAKEELSKLAPLAAAKPAYIEAFAEFNNTVLAEGALSVKTKELIAVAVALTTQCQHCLVIHTENARNAGATEEELAEATFVAATLRAGGAIIHSGNYVMDKKD